MEAVSHPPRPVNGTFYFTADDGSDPITVELEGSMVKLKKRAVAALKNPLVRPLEVWAIRLVLAYVTAQLGIDAAHLVK